MSDVASTGEALAELRRKVSVCDLRGQVVEGELSPSSDTAAHGYVCGAMPDVGGVVHIHSTCWTHRATGSNA